MFNKSYGRFFLRGGGLRIVIQEISHFFRLKRMLKKSYYLEKAVRGVWCTTHTQHPHSNSMMVLYMFQTSLGTTNQGGLTQGWLSRSVYGSVWLHQSPHQLMHDSLSNDRRCLPGIMQNCMQVVIVQQLINYAYYFCAKFHSQLEGKSLIVYHLNLKCLF